MAGLIWDSLLGLCVVITIAGADQNETDIRNPIVENRPDVLPHVSLPPVLTKTWPPFDAPGPELEASPPPDIQPPSEFLGTVVSHKVNILMTTENSQQRNQSQTLTPTPDTEEPTFETDSMTTPVPIQSTPTPTTATTTTSAPSTQSPILKTVSVVAVTVTVVKKPSEDSPKHVSIAVFLAVPVCVGLLISFFILFGKYCRKKLRLDKLRHQLMPMYSFDPAEGEDWETELLTDPRTQVSQQASSTQQVPPKPTTQSEVPQLRFNYPAAEV